MPDVTQAVSTPAAPPPPPPAAPPAAAAATPPPAPAAGAVPPVAPAAGAAPDVTPPAPVTEPAKPAAPASAIEVKLPDGAKMDQAQMDAFKGRAQAIGLNSDQASKLLAQELAAETAMTEQMQRNRVADLDRLKGDKKYGGAMFDQTRAAARSILEKSEHGRAVSKKLEIYGLDCDPDMTKLLAEFSSLISEDSTASRVTNAVPDVQQRPQTQTERMAKRYDAKK